MSPFGSKVQELFQEYHLNAEWLAKTTGIMKSTVSDWMTKPEVTPRPSTIKKVVKAFIAHDPARDAEKLTDGLSEAAGYGMVMSKDENERETRRREALRANDRLARHIDRLIGLDSRRQDELLSWSEAWHSNQNRKDPPKSQ